MSRLEDEVKGIRVSPWIWRIAGLIALVVVAAVAGPDLLSGVSPKQPHSVASPRRSPQWTPPLGEDAISVSARAWAPRGPEAGSTVAAALLARIRVERPGGAQLLWAGSLDGHDHVVLASYPWQPSPSADDSVPVAALRVSRARDIATARSEIIGYVSQVGEVVGLALQGSDRHTRLLLLGRPGQLQAQVSTVVDYHPSGRISRRWRNSALYDGVSVLDLGLHVDPVIVVRTKIPGLTTGTLVRVEGRPQRVGPTKAGGAAERVAVAGVSSPSYAGPDPRLLPSSLTSAFESLFDLADADMTVLWSGPMRSGPAATSGPAIGRAALILVRRHDGPTFRAFVYADRTHGSLSVTANTVRWSVADRLPFAASANEADAPLLLINPGGAGSVTLRFPAGTKRHVVLDSTGIGTLAAHAAAGPATGGAEVLVRSPSGRVVLESAMADPGSLDAFGL